MGSLTTAGRHPRQGNYDRRKHHRLPRAPIHLSVLWPGNDGAVAAGDGNDLDESRDLRTVRSRVSYRERRAEAVAAVEAASGKGFDLTAQ